MCKTKETVEIVRCFRCQAYGHLTQICKGPSRQDVCRKYAKNGHKAFVCDGVEHWDSCRVDGHTSGFLKCPEYKQLLAKERRPSIISQ